MRVSRRILTAFRQWALPLAAGAALCSCADDEGIEGGLSRAIIAFDASINDKPRSRADDDTAAAQCVAVKRFDGADTLFLHIVERDRTVPEATRAAPVVSLSDYGAFGVLGYRYEGAWDEAQVAATPRYMYDAEVREREGVWCPSEAYRWPLAEYSIRFFAYAPYKTAGVVLPEADEAGTPVMRYTVPADATKQRDLLATRTEELRGGAGHVPASLTFRHALTAIRFVAGDAMLPGKVTRIALKGVHGAGAYTFEPDTWTVDEATTDFTYAFSKTTDGTPDAEITPAAATFMMIPQTLPEGAVIEVDFADRLSGVKQTLSASVAGTEWRAGHTVEYRVSTTSIIITPHLTVTPPDDFAYTGGKAVYAVDSRVDIATADEEPLRNIPVAWSAQFSTDGGITWSDTKPEWLTVCSAAGSGNDGSASELCQIAVAAQKGSTNNAHNEKLRNTTPLTGTFDLSTKGGTTSMNTANCYVVNAPGTYRLPLVYGNAIKEGVANPTAYTSVKTGNSVLHTFLNHLNAEITDPYIYNNAGCTTHDASLIWQDVPGMVQEVKLTSDKRAIMFRVASENIMQGNALVAVRDADSTIMWSWHIWVTDYVLGSAPDEITNFQGVRFTLLPYAIGWCDSEKIVYAERDVKIRITQEQTEKEYTFTVVQKAEQLTNCSNQSYFQWGRKDPILGGNVIVGSDAMVDKQCYTDVPDYAYAPVNARTSISNAIQMPYRQFCGAGNWCNTNYRNLWNADNNALTANSNTIVKTIYDPSPAGYCVPPSQAFTGFTTTGGNVTDAALMNVSGVYDWGWNYYCAPTPDADTPTTYFAASGYRALSNGTIKALGVRGYAWTAGPIDGAMSWSLFYTDAATYPLYKLFEKAYSFPVRPCREQ